MNFTLSELENLLNKIEDILTYVEETKYQDKESKIYLCNGDAIRYKVSNKCVPHLLGININYLVSTGLFKNGSAFEITKELCENAYRINKAAKDGIISYDKLFSKHIINKIDRFIENIKINIFETELVCKYDSSRSYHITDKNEKYDYIIIRKYDDGKFGVLCLVKSNNYYVPMSNQLYNDKASLENALSDLISNQAITIINCIKLTDRYDYHSKDIYLKYDSKIKKLDTLFPYSEKYKCIIDVTSDYKYAINKLLKDKNTQNDDNNIIDKIVDSIKNGEIIDSAYLKIQVYYQ